MTPEVAALPRILPVPFRKLRAAPSTGSRSSTSLVPGLRKEGREMGDMEEERSILEALDPGKQEEISAEEQRSILLDINHIREHIETLEDAARAKAVESDLARELADTNRMSVATARVVRDRLAAALRALAEALVSAEGPNSKS